MNQLQSQILSVNYGSFTLPDIETDRMSTEPNENLHQSLYL